MFVRIAVLDPLPLVRHGIMITLREAGLGSESPDDVFAWLNDQPSRVVVLTLSSADDWDRLNRLRRTYEDVLVVALLTDDQVTTHVRALVSGAVAALPRHAQPPTVRAAVESVVEGRTVLPIEVLRGLLNLEHQPADRAVPSPKELDWLSSLASGSTVAELAQRSGYSERMMFRLLRQLYTRLDVAGRTEALLLARERGWL